jgi:RNA 2',3'-cyclic 3'-phosphodiesterase
MPEARLPFRGFVAVALPESIRSEAAAVVDRLRGAAEVRWTAMANFHLTLKFLGNVSPQALPELTGGLAAVAREAAPFSIALGGAGAFPRPERPQVVWIGLTAGQEALADLAARVDVACARAGFAAEQRPYRAHLTLGRVKNPPGVAPAGGLPARLRALGDVALGSARVESLELMQSTLTPRGPIYSVVETFVLARATSP